MEPHAVVAAPMEGYNPFDFAHPSFGPFTDLVSGKVGLLLGVVWAGAFCVVAFFLVEGLVRMGKARRLGASDGYEEARSSLGWPVVSIIGLSVVPVLFGVLAQ